MTTDRLPGHTSFILAKGLSDEHDPSAFTFRPQRIQLRVYFVFVLVSQGYLDNRRHRPSYMYYFSRSVNSV